MATGGITARIDTKGAEDWLNGALDRVVNGVFLEMVDNIRDGAQYSPGTPKDTGFAAASWWEGINEVGDPVQPERPDPDDEGKAVPLPEIAKLGKAGDIFYLSSNCVYIRRLEYDGHSQQAPQGFVRLTMAAMQTILDSHVLAVRSR